MTWIVAEMHRALGVFTTREARVQPVVWLGTRAFAPAPETPRLPKLPAAIWLLLWRRMSRLGTRFQVLVDRWRSNTLPTPRPRRPARPCATHPATPVLRLPRAHGWVNHRIPESAPCSGQFEALLHDPEARALVQAAPQAGRLLRPLCRALGVPQPDWLRLPRRSRPPASEAPAPCTLTPTPGDPPAPPLGDPPTPDRPLQPYVRAAVRAWTKKSG